MMFDHLLELLPKKDYKALARTISIIENEVTGFEDLLTNLPVSNTPVIGITGPPGAGKSTLTDALINEIVSSGKSVGVLCIDPSSPFNLGALLGDRIRMSTWYTHPSVFIRSLATRGSLGGLHPMIIEITDVMKAAGFDYIIVETVGVGQSEVEIAGLADITVVVLVPEGGDEIQNMKVGLMEIADIFVVNKSDRPDADTFAQNLQQMIGLSSIKHHQQVPVLKTVASQNKGIDVVMENIASHFTTNEKNERHFWLLAEKAFYIIRQHRMKDVDKITLKHQLETETLSADFNLYKFIKDYTKGEMTKNVDLRLSSSSDTLH